MNDHELDDYATEISKLAEIEIALFAQRAAEWQTKDRTMFRSLEEARDQ